MQHITVDSSIDDAGWMVCDFKAGEDHYHLMVEATYHDPLIEIKDFLEEICLDSNNKTYISLFQNDIEERLTYTPITSEYGVFSIEWRNEFEVNCSYTMDFSVVVNRDTFVRAFYTSVIDFYLSGKYNSNNNEAYTLQEIFEQKFNCSILNLEIINIMLGYSIHQLELLLLSIFNEPFIYSETISLKKQFDRLIKIAEPKEFEYEEELWSWHFTKISSLSEMEKEELLLEAIQSKKSSYGFRLKDFRSENIEKYLLNKTDGESLKYDYIYFGIEDEIDLKFYASINGERFLKTYYLNIFELWNSIANEGKYELFVCNCGSQECAGIFETPKVTFDGETVIWEIFEPERHTFKFKRSCLRSEINELKVNMLIKRSFPEWKNIQYLFQNNLNEFLSDFIIDECGKS